MPLVSLLLDLPTEVRLQVYHQLFTGQTVRAKALHCPTTKDEGSQRWSLQPHSPILNIFFTCRTVYAEAVAALYTNATFRFDRCKLDTLEWSSKEVRAAFYSCRPHPAAGAHVANRIELVRHVYYAGNDPDLVRDIGMIFPSLRNLVFDLNYDHLGIDQTVFDRAMKYAMRNRDWRHAIKDALEQRFPNGMVNAVWELQKLSRAECGFSARLYWRLGYLFLEFEGECDLDEWILRVHDADGQSKNIYDIRQDPLFFEMG